jgi:hypothetical protein
MSDMGIFDQLTTQKNALLPLYQTYTFLLEGSGIVIASCACAENCFSQVVFCPFP